MICTERGERKRERESEKEGKSWTLLSSRVLKTKEKEGVDCGSHVIVFRQPRKPCYSLSLSQIRKERKETFFLRYY